MVLIAWMFFYVRTKDDSYSKKVEASKFLNFYESSINGNVDLKETFGRGGDYFSIEGSKNKFHVRTIPDENNNRFFDYLIIGDKVQKDAFSREICIHRNEVEFKCFSYVVN